MRLVALLVLLVSVLAVPPAAAQEPPAKKERVEFLRFVPEPGIISARLRGSLMYVSAESGLSIYDVSNPEQPDEVGRLPLPNFENEDIDVGGNIALVSNDPNEGAGLLHVIDISNPAAPKRLSSFNTGTADNGILTKPLLGPAGFGYGTGHTASCVADCRYAYLAGTLQGIDIVDLRDPANPKYVKNFPAEEATFGLASHDVQFDAKGNALVSGGGGVAAYDVSDPENPKLAYRTDDTAKSRLGAEPVNDGSTLNDYIHHNSMRLTNANIAGSSGRPEADSDILAITEEDYTRPACQGAGSFQTWKLEGDLARNLDRWDVEIDPARQSLCSAHYFDVRGGLVAQGWYEQGTRFLDVSDPADIRQVGYWIPNKNVTWGAVYPPTDATGEIVYALDNARGIDVLRFDRPEPGAAPLPAVVAPPGNAPEPGGGPGGGDGGPSPAGTAAGARTNVALTVSDRRVRTRRGTRLRYAVTVRHTAGPAARDLEVLLRFPRGLMKRGKTRVFRRLPQLAPGASRTWRVTVRLPRRSKLRNVFVQARLTLADDANPRDNRAVDRTAVARRRARAMTRAEHDRLLAENLALLPDVRAPRGSGGRAQQIPARRSAYGWVCRV